MTYKYEHACESSKLLYAKDLSGLPKDIELLFNNVHVRFYKSRDMKGDIFCTLANPTFPDGDGYVRELEFSASTHDEESGNCFGSEYSFHNEHDFETLKKSIVCTFEDKTEMGKRMLLLNMRIKGTPFNGAVLVDQDWYKKNNAH